MRTALTIAGSDSGGGAGIQADLKTFAAFGVYGTTAITALTAQDTVAVRGVHLVPSAFVAAQIDAVVTDLGCDAVKTGMLGTAAIVETVAAAITRHRLPYSLAPVVTFLPFRLSGAILALTSLDFLGLGVPPGTPSLGELLSQGKNNIDAWWISLSTFGVLVMTLLLLTFMGDALRDALDPRKADA